MRAINFRVKFGNEVVGLRDEWSQSSTKSGANIHIRRIPNGYRPIADVDDDGTHIYSVPKILSCNWIEEELEQ